MESFHTKQRSKENCRSVEYVEDIRTCGPHLEGEEIFGSTKRKLDVPIGNARDSH